MFLSREIDIQLCQIYAKIHINAIMYKSCSIKQIKFNKHETNLKTISSQVCLLNRYIIIYSPYSPYYITRTSANDSIIVGNHVTSILLCHWWYFWSRDFSFRFSKFYIFEFSYNFNTVVYQFLETGTSDKTFMGRDQELKWLAFNLYLLSTYTSFQPIPPFIFPLQSF